MMVTVSTITLLILALGVLGIGFSLGWLFRIDAFVLFKKRGEKEAPESTSSADR